MKFKRLSLILAACTGILTAGTAVCAQEITAGSSTFQDLTIVDNDDFSMKVTCDDQDLEDGYIWNVQFENKSKTADYAVSLMNTALSGVMCETDEWELSGWTIKAGGKKDAIVTWPVENIRSAQIDRVDTAAFELKVYRNNHFQESDAMCVDDRFTVIMGETVVTEEETEEAEALSEDLEEDSTEADMAEETAAGEEENVLLDNESFKVVLLSYGEDSEGLPVWHMLLENHTENTVMFELDNSVINEWVISPYWTQVVLPGSKAYSDISWWNIDVDPELIKEVESASFDILIWNKQKGWNDTYTGAQDYSVALGAAAEEQTEDMPEEETASEETEAAETEPPTEVQTEAAETEAPETEVTTEAAETEAPETEAPTEAAETEVQTEAAETEEAETEVQTEAAETEAPTEEAETEAVETEAAETEAPETEALTETAETEVQTEAPTDAAETEVSETEEIVFFTSEEGTMSLQSISVDLAGGYGMLGLHLENTGTKSLTCAITGAKVDGQDVNLEWNQKMPAASRKNSTVYLDLSSLENDPDPEKLELSVEVTSSAAALTEGIFEIDLKTMELLGQKMQELSAPAEDQYTDADSIRNLQASLKNAGYEVGEVDGKIGDATRKAIQAYRDANGLAPGNTVDDALLYALGVADSATYKKVQEVLTQEGYDVGTPDGLTGRKSREAIADYRRKHSLPGEGVDEQLLAAMGILAPQTEAAAGTEAQTEPAAETEAQTEPAAETEAQASDLTEDQYTDTDTIRNLKAGLREAGYETDRESNEMTQGLRDMIADFRSKNGLPQSEYIDDELLFALNVADAATYKALQTALNEAGYNCGEPDGLYGRKTREAVESFRQVYRLEGTGIDEELLKALGIR